jgi:outer membrane protein assembly factor BamA
VGYPSLVRGYDPYSFNASECTVTVTGGCPELDDMEGSRMMVINAEARMPLFGFRGGLSYGPIPAEVFGFFDAGVAWTQATRPQLFSSGDRNWVKSAGVGARVNAMGFLILEFNMAKAIDRPEQGWMYVFNMRPGF